MDKWEYTVLTIAKVHYEEPGGVFKSARSGKRYVADLQYAQSKDERHVADTFVDALNWAGARGWRATGDGVSRTGSDADRQRLRPHGQPEMIRFFYLVRRIS